jgi:predicted MFS family arabinose efflux permease
MEPMLSVQTLGVIGGFNVLGSLLFGWAGGRCNKRALLGGIYLCRLLVLGLYFMVPPTPATTLVFGAFMGFLRLGVAPLIAGATAELFELKDASGGCLHEPSARQFCRCLWRRADL